VLRCDAAALTVAAGCCAARHVLTFSRTYTHAGCAYSRLLTPAVRTHACCAYSRATARSGGARHCGSPLPRLYPAGTVRYSRAVGLPRAALARAPARHALHGGCSGALRRGLCLAGEYSGRCQRGTRGYSRDSQVLAGVRRLQSTGRVVPGTPAGTARVQVCSAALARPRATRAVVLCAGAYVSGAAGSNACPAGSVRIETEAACRTAAAAAAKTIPSNFVETDPGYPRGCYLTTNNAYFNTDAVGAGNSYSRLLCAALVTTGAPSCALHGSVGLAGVWLCRTAFYIGNSRRMWYGTLHRQAYGALTG
jgi:hypothetical protein